MAAASTGSGAFPLILAIFVLGALELMVASLLLGVPLLFAWIRRLHDLGRTGWWAPAINVVANVGSYALDALLPDLAGAIGALLLFFIPVIALGTIRGQPEENEFGSTPGRKPGPNLKETFS